MMKRKPKEVELEGRRERDEGKEEEEVLERVGHEERRRSHAAEQERGVGSVPKAEYLRVVPVGRRDGANIL